MTAVSSLLQPLRKRDHLHDGEYMPHNLGTLNIDAIDHDKSVIFAKENSGWVGGVKPAGTSNAFGVIHLSTHVSGYCTQLGLDSSNNRLWLRSATTGDLGTWLPLAKAAGPGTTGHVPYWSSDNLTATSPIQTDGTNVSINGMTPVSNIPLAINGVNTTAGNGEGLRIYRPDSTSQFIAINEADGSKHRIQAVGNKPFEISSTADSFGIGFYTNSTFAGEINESGNWLIGTATDNITDKLQVAGMVSASRFKAQTYTTSNATTEILITKSGTASESVAQGAGMTFGNTTAGKYSLIQSADDVLQYFQYDTSWQERFRIASGGNFLIGTTTDNLSDKLQVNGDGYFSEDLTVGAAGRTSNTILTVQSAAKAGVEIIADDDNATETHNPYLYMVQDGAAVRFNMGFNDTDRDAMYNSISSSGGISTNSFVFHNQFTTDTIFASAGTEVMRIGSNGTVTATTFAGSLTGNVTGSATKLATARTLWGQSFDGTGNVDGLLTITQNTRGLIVQAASTTGVDSSIEIRGSRNGSVSDETASISLTNYDHDDLDVFEFARIYTRADNASTHTARIGFKVAAAENTLMDALVIDYTRAVTMYGAVTAPSFVGDLTGNADTATNSTQLGGVSSSLFPQFHTTDQRDDYLYLKRNDSAGNPVFYVRQAGTSPIARFMQSATEGVATSSTMVTITNSGGVLATGNLEGANGIFTTDVTVGGNSVWHEGNFDPSSIVGGAVVDDAAPSHQSGQLWYNPDAGALNISVASNWVSIGGRDGLDGVDGSDGQGWTGASYNASTGIITFSSSDGLGFSTGDLRASLTDGSVSYAKVADALKSRTTDNDGAWDFSANGIIDAAFTGNTTVTFSNLQQNKTIVVKLVTTNSPVITLPSYVITFDGSADPSENGTFWLYFHCLDDGSGTEEVTLSIAKSQ